jgi:hypothetical protein
MFLQWLKRLATRIVNRRGPSSGPFQDPYAGVREPRKPGPGGRSSAVAVMEPEPRQAVDANGRSWRRARRQ